MRLFFAGLLAASALAASSLPGRALSVESCPPTAQSDEGGCEREKKDPPIT